VPAAVELLESQSPSWRSRAIILARLARRVPEVENSYKLWLDALVASRMAGTQTVLAVLAEGQEILPHAPPGSIAATLISEFAALHSATLSHRGTEAITTFLRKLLGAKWRVDGRLTVTLSDLTITTDPDSET
jgi:hypothetical protein